MTVYKIVDTGEGLAVAHLQLFGQVVSPESADSRIRVSKVITEYIENDESLGWGPVDQRTVYRVGEMTEADSLNQSRDVMSGKGLHAFTHREDALYWREQADLDA